MGQPVLFQDLSDLSENLRVIEELFKRTDGSRVIMDKGCQRSGSSILSHTSVTHAPKLLCFT